jgi:uncharacterized membrane protein YfcA
LILPLVFGLLVGATLGFLGGGGSALAIPLLAYGIGLEAREAIATSLVVVGLAALAGAIRNWYQGTVDVRVALIFGVFGFVGSAAGAQIARVLPPAVQMTLFAVSMLVAAVLMLRRSSPPASQAAATRWGLKAVVAALAAGLLTGIVGIGGGFVVVPALVFAVKMPMHRAVGSSLLVIAFNASGGLLSYASYMSLTPAVVVPFAAAAIVAAVTGTILARQMEALRLQFAFAFALLAIGIFTIAREGLVLWN